jgi:hypothetical protein
MIDELADELDLSDYHKGRIALIVNFEVTGEHLNQFEEEVDRMLKQFGGIG